MEIRLFLLVFVRFFPILVFVRSTSPHSDSSVTKKPTRFSALLLILANLIPLLGAVALGWSVFEIVVVYWVENLIVGLLNVFKLLRTPAGNPPSPSAWVARIAQTIFFLVHYGIFCLVHGVFVFALLGGGFSNNGPQTQSLAPLSWAILALFVSHLFSFFVNFLGKKEYIGRTLSEQMMAPYPRMIALHVAIVLGAFAVQALGQPLFLLIILVVGKTIADWKLHLRSHRPKSSSS